MDTLKYFYEVSPFFFTLTASASLLFSLSNLLMIFGGSEMGEGDLGGDHHLASEASFKFFSTQTILAFFMGLGWAGLTSIIRWNYSFFPALAIGLCFGYCLMTFSAFLMFRVQKLNHTPRINIYSALGNKAIVYTTIPRHEEGSGQIQVDISGQQKIWQAISTDESILSFTEVEIVGVKDQNILIVRPIMEKKNDV